jgi:hypothetical protein
VDNIFRRVDADGEADYDSPPCPKSCAPRVSFVDAAAGRRSLQELVLRDVNTSFIDKRQMTLPEGSMDDFMRDEVPQAKSIVWKLPSGSDLNTSIKKPLGRLAISLGTSGLCGCSSLWIISRTGVYASHWWESISFAPNKEWRLTTKETNTAVFMRTLINPLSAGAKTSSGTPTQWKLDPADYDDDNIKAYLVHPNKNCYGKEDGYRSQWDKIKKEVGNIIPSLNPETFPDRWVEPIYVRLDPDDPKLDLTAAGHVLFKYDPNHNGKKKAVLWVEANPIPIHDDEW